MLRMRSVPERKTKISRSGSCSPDNGRFWSFHVVVLQRTAKKYTKSYNARAQPILCSLNLLFGDILVVVVVVVCQVIRNLFIANLHTAISVYVVGSKLQTYATRPNGSMGRSRRLLHVPNTNEV